MKEREIVLFRYRKGLRIGYHLETVRNKVRVATEKDRSFTVPVENVIYGTACVAAGQSDLKAFSRKVESLAAEIDLEELWELVRGDAQDLELDDLAALYWGDESGSDRYAALIWHLNGDRCPYFTVRGELYAPVAESQVAEHKERLLRQAQEASEESSFVAWLSGGETGELAPAAISGRQRSWLDRLVDFTVAGDDSRQSAWAKSFLARLQKGGDPRRFAFDRLVRLGVLRPDENLDLRRLQVPVEFSEAAREAAADYNPRAAVSAPERRDLRDLEVFSIDSESTTDVDDALSLSVTDGGYEIGIHITDLSVVVEDGATLDDVARERVVSFYFPETRIPMLPPSLSSGHASLLEGEERPVVTLLARFDRAFELTGVELARGRIVNRHQLSYEQVDGILQGAQHSLAERLAVLDELARVRRRSRMDAGGIEFERPEVEIHVDEAGEVGVECRDRETRANRLVSEVMILYNVEVAKYCAANAIPFVYRIQAVIDDLPEVSAESDAYERYQFFKAVTPSRFSMQGEPHGLLGVELYSQVSSPMRRYIDLIAQRQLVHFLSTGEVLYSEEEFGSVVFEAEARLRELGRLEFLRERHWLLKYLADRRHESFEACVLEVRERDCLVELEGYGLRAPASVPGDVKPGDKLTVELTHIDGWDQHVRFCAKG